MNIFSKFSLNTQQLNGLIRERNVPTADEIQLRPRRDRILPEMGHVVDLPHDLRSIYLVGIFFQNTWGGS